MTLNDVINQQRPNKTPPQLQLLREEMYKEALKTMPSDSEYTEVQLQELFSNWTPKSKYSMVWKKGKIGRHDGTRFIAIEKVTKNKDNRRAESDATKPVLLYKVRDRKQRMKWNTTTIIDKMLEQALQNPDCKMDEDSLTQLLIDYAPVVHQDLLFLNGIPGIGTNEKGKSGFRSLLTIIHEEKKRETKRLKKMDEAREELESAGIEASKRKKGTVPLEETPDGRIIKKYGLLQRPVRIEPGLDKTRKRFNANKRYDEDESLRNKIKHKEREKYQKSLEDGPYPCDHCSFVTPTKQQLRVHCKKFHTPLSQLTANDKLGMNFLKYFEEHNELRPAGSISVDSPSAIEPVEWLLSRQRRLTYEHRCKYDYKILVLDEEFSHIKDEHMGNMEAHLFHLDLELKKEKKIVYADVYFGKSCNPRPCCKHWDETNVLHPGSEVVREIKNGRVAYWVKMWGYSSSDAQDNLDKHDLLEAVLQVQNSSI